MGAFLGTRPQIRLSDAPKMEKRLCRNGLFLAGVDGLYQTLAIGILVIVAVAVDQWIRKVRK